MRRRDVLIDCLAVASAIALGAAASIDANAQRPTRMYRLGFLTTASGPADRHRVLESVLADLGYRESDNLVIERRYAAGHLDRLPALAADLVSANVDVIVTETTPAAVAAKRATARIPIVMATSGDAIGSGLVVSLARPGGNVTGLSFLGTPLGGKRVEFLRELKPGARGIGYFSNSQIVPEQLTFRELEAAAAALGMKATYIDAPDPAVFESAFATMAETGMDVAMVAESAAYTDRRDQIVELAARHRLPIAYGRREFVDAGGLLSYGTNFTDLFRRAAIFVDRIFKGANPADLPVQQPTKFELVINLTAVRSLGLTIPRSLLARADEVIE